MSESDLIAKADRALESARLLQSGGHHEACISRAYYAMRHAAQAALLSKGESPSTHQGVISRFGEIFVKTGILPQRSGKDFSRALERRLVSDYDSRASLNAGDADRTLRDAEEFVARVRSLLSSMGLL